MKPGLTKQILKYTLIVSVAITVPIALVWLILQGYSYPWTGFGEFTKPDSNFVPRKTLWDWLQLFIIPIVLTIGVFWLNRSERESEHLRAEERAKLEREIATDRQQEAALQSYLDRMADLLLKEKLRTTKSGEARDVARTRTLSVLQGLDAKRKGYLLLFLKESGLIAQNPIINLTGADLGGANLVGADLTGAGLTGANLIGADLIGAKLTEANLTRAKLTEANLTGIDLTGADLTKAKLFRAKLFSANLPGANLTGANLGEADLALIDLTGANLTEANLGGADLTNANLTKADLTNARFFDKQLAQVGLLKSTIMPDGTKHD